MDAYCLRILAIMNIAAVNKCAWKFRYPIRILFSFSLDIYPEVGLLDHMIVLFSIFLNYGYFMCLLLLLSHFPSSCCWWGLLFLQCMDFSLCWLLVPGASLVMKRRLYSTRASIIMMHGLSCSAACEIFLDQGLNPCPLHWQVDSYPLEHQESLRC